MAVTRQAEVNGHAHKPASRAAEPYAFCKAGDLVAPEQIILPDPRETWDRPVISRDAVEFARLPSVNRHAMLPPIGVPKQPNRRRRFRWRDAVQPSHSAAVSGQQDPRYSLVLKRHLSLAVSPMSHCCVRGPRRAVVIFAPPKTEGRSPKSRMVVTMIKVRSTSLVPLQSSERRRLCQSTYKQWSDRIYYTIFRKKE